MSSLSVVVAAVQHDTAAVAVPAASQHRMDTRFHQVKFLTFQSARVAQLVQVSLTAETLAETVRNQVSPAAVQESEVAAVKAVNVQ
jgi:hypothetical protein